MKLRNDYDQIVCRAIAAIQPDAAVRRALGGNPFQGGRVVLVAMGKAAWSTARAACDCMGGQLDDGIITTRHGHAQGPIGSLLIREVGYPIPNQDTFSAMGEALTLTDGLTAEDTALFLLSGGGSALFEVPLVPQGELQSITQSLLASGVDIVEMNTICKRLSTVKGGRFAQYCAPAKVFPIVLSNIIGDPLGMIASGPAYPDSSACVDARRIVEQCGLRLSPEASQCLGRETPRVLSNVETLITGNVRELCAAASVACRELGCEPAPFTDSPNCEAREAGAFLAAVARAHQDTDCLLAFLAGRETVVHLTGSGLGGRSQELALFAATGIAGLGDIAVFSLGSDGTDGPTDAADGFVDGGIKERLVRQGVRIFEVLKNSNAYRALAACGSLPRTGATGTNANDAAVLLIRRQVALFLRCVPDFPTWGRGRALLPARSDRPWTSNR